LGVIHIVRDPRNVITSIKNHYYLNSYNKAKQFIFDENKFVGLEDKNTKISDNKILTLVGSWKTNYNSWKNTKKNYLLIKYENLIENPETEFHKIISYLKNLLNITISNDKISKAIESTSFKNLQTQEKLGKFTEYSRVKKTGDKIKFFYLGPENKWKKFLDKETCREVEEKFSVEMKELGYLN